MVCCDRLSTLLLSSPFTALTLEIASFELIQLTVLAALTVLLDKVKQPCRSGPLGRCSLQTQPRSSAWPRNPSAFSGPLLSSSWTGPLPSGSLLTPHLSLSPSDWKSYFTAKLSTSPLGTGRNLAISALSFCSLRSIVFKATVFPQTCNEWLFQCTSI